MHHSVEGPVQAVGRSSPHGSTSLQVFLGRANLQDAASKLCKQLSTRILGAKQLQENSLASKAEPSGVKVNPDYDCLKKVPSMEQSPAALFSDIQGVVNRVG